MLTISSSLILFPNAVLLVLVFISLIQLQQVTTRIEAFTLPLTTTTTTTTIAQQRVTKLLLSSTNNSNNNEVEALLAAAKKAREEANRLSEELGKPITSTSSSTTATTATTTEVAPVNVQEMIQTILPSILSETSNLQNQKEQWDILKNEKRTITQFGSANVRTYPVSLSMLEQRTGFTAKSLGLTGDTLNGDVTFEDLQYSALYVTGGSTILAIASLALLPPNIGATACYAFALVPVLFIGIGSTAPGLIADGIASLRSGISNNNENNGNNSDGSTTTISTKQDRICRHEAAHFCCGYWCGLPISSYNTETISNINVPRVEFDIATPIGKGYTSTEIAALTITAMSGLVGEAMKYGTIVDGSATQDLVTLENSIFRKSQDFIGAAASQDLTRWGVLASYLLLQQNKDTYEKVVTAFQRQASIEECITILEKYSS